MQHLKNHPITDDSVTIQYKDFNITGTSNSKEYQFSISRIDGGPITSNIPTEYSDSSKYYVYTDYTTPDGERLQSINHAINNAKKYIDTWERLKLGKTKFIL